MTLRETVLAALDADAARSCDEITEDTGLERRQVGNVLNQMQTAGQCKRTAEGWIRTPSGTPPQASPTAAVATARKVREPKAKPVKKRAPKVDTKALTPIKGREVAVASNGHLHFVLTERMELGIERPGGARGTLTAEEAVRLHDFLTMVRPALLGRAQ